MFYLYFIYVLSLLYNMYKSKTQWTPFWRFDCRVFQYLILHKRLKVIKFSKINSKANIHIMTISVSINIKFYTIVNILISKSAKWLVLVTVFHFCTYNIDLFYWTLVNFSLGIQVPVSIIGDSLTSKGTDLNLLIFLWLMYIFIFLVRILEAQYNISEFSYSYFLSQTTNLFR